MKKEDDIEVKSNRFCVVEYMANLNQALRRLVVKRLRDGVVAEAVQI